MIPKELFLVAFMFCGAQVYAQCPQKGDWKVIKEVSCAGDDGSIEIRLEGDANISLNDFYILLANTSINKPFYHSANFFEENISKIELNGNVLRFNNLAAGRYALQMRSGNCNSDDRKGLIQFDSEILIGTNCSE